MRFEDYAIRIEPLPCEEGGGFLVTVPDLPGCMAPSSKPSPKRKTPSKGGQWRTPGQGRPAHAQGIQRIPESLHQRLATRATAEGVSLNQLAATYLAQGLGHSG